MTHEKHTFQFAYEVKQDLVMIQSQMTGSWQGFIRQSILDFIEWLRSDSWKREKWFHLHMVYNY